MTSHGIRAVFWDIGGVLASNGWDREERARVVAQFGLDAGDFQERHKQIVPELEVGRITLDDYLDQTVFWRPQPFTREAFKGAILAQSQPHPDTLAFARDLGARHRLYALNNESRELNDHRIQAFGLGDVLLAFFSSCYLGLSKPGPAIYRAALDLAGVRPGQAVMIDDRAQNVEAARGVGMQGIQYENVEQLKKALSELGVE